MITAAAMKNGFTGGLIVDFPNSNKAKKYFLNLSAGYSPEVSAEAKLATMKMPQPKTEGEDYSDSDSEDDDEMSGSQEDGKEEENWESDDEDGTGKKNNKQAREKVAFLGKKRKSKMIQKAMKKVGRFKANGNRKNKEWIMKKKDRMRKQGHKVKGDSKYSGRRRSKF